MNFPVSTAAPLPANEAVRLAALRELHVLDTEADDAFDLIAAQAAQLCGTPTALISLVDADRQWFLARQGMAARETPRDVSFCAHAILEPGVLEVADAHGDPRFARNPMVTGAPHIRFYAGAPIVLAQGEAIGTLCAIAPHAHRLDARQLAQLEGLARLVATLLQARRRRAVADRDVAERTLLERDLLQSEQRYRSLFDHMRSGFALHEVILDDAGVAVDLRYLAVNAPHATMMGFDVERMTGARLSALYPAGLPESGEWLRVFAQVAREGDTRAFERRSAHDGRWYSIVAYRPAPNQFATIVEDITERRTAHERVQAQHEQLQVTLHSIGDAVITTDNAGRVQYLNPVAERLTGWRDGDARGHALEDVYQVVDETTRAALPNPVTPCLATSGDARATRAGEPTAEGPHAALVGRHGAEAGIEQTVAPICAADGRVLGAVLVFRDVTDRRRMVREMSYRATHDALTGLVNRADFESRLQHTLRLAHVDGSVHALLTIDLDQFKLVNDACGHAAGDQLLRQAAALLKQGIRTRDTLARLGGDEFGLILQFCGLEQAQRVAQQICDRMDEYRFVHGDRRFRIGASIGVVPLDKRWPTAATVMQASDVACYAAKEAGRNRVHAWADADQNLRQRQGAMQWVARLEQALDEDLFELHAQRIQPIRAAAGGLHCEVLLRLRGDDGVLVQPGAFLPAAERFHLATRIDQWVVRAVVDWMARRHDTLDDVATLAVNLSGQSISDPAFLRQVSEIVAGARFDARKLCFEVTETAAITNMADATAFIDAMRCHGIRFALDDFGAGASGFSYLKTLKVDYLKIDGQFIRGLRDDPLDRVTVQSFRDVAAVVGTQTIAESVEDEATAALLREIGIDYAQGYLYHRPAPLDEVVGTGGRAEARRVGQSVA